MPMFRENIFYDETSLIATQRWKKNRIFKRYMDRGGAEEKRDGERGRERERKRERERERERETEREKERERKT